LKRKPKGEKSKERRPMDSGALGTSGEWRTQVDQAKVYSRASRLRKNSMGWSIDAFN